MKEYIKPNINIVILSEVMQNLYNTSTDEEQLAKPNVGGEDLDDGWGMRNWENDYGTWDEK